MRNVARINPQEITGFEMKSFEKTRTFAWECGHSNESTTKLEEYSKNRGKATDAATLSKDPLFTPLVLTDGPTPPVSFVRFLVCPHTSQLTPDDWFLIG